MLSQLASFPSFLWLNEISFYTYTHTHTHTQGFPGGSVVKNLPVNAGDMSLIPGQQRSPGEGNSNLSGIIAWEIPWQRSLAGYSPGGYKRVGHDLATKQPQHVCVC